MFPVYPLGPDENINDYTKSVYRETFQGKQSIFENPRHQNLRTSIRTNCNPLIPFLLTEFPPGYEYKPEHVGIVKELREMYDKMVRDSFYSTYNIDYGGMPSGIKYLAEAYPTITGRDIYKAPRPPESVSQVSYQAVRVPKELKVHPIKRDEVARRGMMPMMYPHGNIHMDTQTEVQFQFHTDLCRKCLGNGEKHMKPKGPPTKEPKMTKDYMPVPMQPIT